MLYGSLFIYNTITALSFCQCNSFPFAHCLYVFISKPGSIPNLTMRYFPEVHRGAITTLPLGEHTDPDIRRAACAATGCTRNCKFCGIKKARFYRAFLQLPTGVGPVTSALPTRFPYVIISYIFLNLAYLQGISLFYLFCISITFAAFSPCSTQIAHKIQL